jgi:hypothetical protein
MLPYPTTAALIFFISILLCVVEKSNLLAKVHIFDGKT